VNVSRRWLEAFLRRPLDAKDVAEKLAMLGAPADAVVPLLRDFLPSLDIKRADGTTDISAGVTP